MKNPTLFAAVIGVIALVVISLGASARYFIAYEANQQTAFQSAVRDINLQLNSQQEKIASASHQLELLVSANQSVAQKLEIEKAGRLSAAADAQRAQQKISQLEQDLNSAKAPDISAIISEWRPRVASVKCHWDLPKGASAEDSGSGVLMSNATSPTIITNRHVVVYLGVTARHCAIKFPGEDIITVVYTEDLHPSPNGVDWATINLSKPSPYIKSLALGTTKRCSTKASAGDSVVILGYPAIGSRDDVTATEGIISGYEDTYYIASAKVERGNSGGAAIATKQNCYLGIPTYVGAGQLETLARILDQGNIP